MEILGWCSLMFILSSWPDLRWSELGALDYVFRKGAHITEYLVLTLLIIRWGRLRGWRGVWWWAALLTLIFSMTDEYHQTLVSGRSGTPEDVIIDTFGILIGVLVDRTPNK